MLLLRLTSTTPVGPTLRALERAVRQQVDDLPFGGRTAGRTDWPWGRGLVAIAGLTLGVTAPAGLWYLCVPLTSCVLALSSSCVLSDLQAAHRG